MTNQTISTIATKADLLANLQLCRTSFLYGHVLMFIAFPQDWSHVQNEIADFPLSDGNKINVPLSGFFSGISKLSDRPDMRFEYTKLLRRALLAEQFEAVINYCGKSDQLAVIKSASWYEFARLVRNTVSHNEGGTIHWDPDNRLRKKGITSVSWRHKTVDESMDGQSLEMLDGDILLFHKDLCSFVENGLS